MARSGPGVRPEEVDQSEWKHVTFSLSGEDLDKLNGAAQALGIEPVEFLRRALADEFWIQERIDAGGTFIHKDSSGKLREVLFR